MYIIPFYSLNCFEQIIFFVSEITQTQKSIKSQNVYSLLLMKIAGHGASKSMYGIKNPLSCLQKKEIIKETVITMITV